MSLEPVMELVDVSKRYGQQVALHRVTWQVPPGVVFGVVGENGAGKSTAIRILLGLAEADAGNARVLGLDSRHQGLQIRRRVGYVPERPALDDWMTARQVGWFAAGFYPPGFEQRYLARLAAFQVPLDRQLKQLSKGMRSKIALALALAHEPDVLILDEPTSGLDTLVRREFLESMVDYTSQGRTVLICSHQIHELERVADIVAILKSGELVACEPLDQLKHSTTAVTATLREAGNWPELPAGILQAEVRGRQAELMVRANVTDAAALVRSLPRVAQVEPRMPTLEEIFVAFMQASSVDPVNRDFSEQAPRHQDPWQNEVQS